MKIKHREKDDLHQHRVTASTSNISRDWRTRPPYARAGRARSSPWTRATAGRGGSTCRVRLAAPRSREGSRHRRRGYPPPPEQGRARAGRRCVQWPHLAALRPCQPAAPGHRQRLLRPPGARLALLLRHRRHDAHREVVRLGQVTSGELQPRARRSQAPRSGGCRRPNGAGLAADVGGRRCPHSRNCARFAEHVGASPSTA